MPAALPAALVPSSGAASARIAPLFSLVSLQCRVRHIHIILPPSLAPATRRLALQLALISMLTKHCSDALRQAGQESTGKRSQRGAQLVLPRLTGRCRCLSKPKSSGVTGDSCMLLKRTRWT